MIRRTALLLDMRRSHPALRQGGRLPLLADRTGLVMAKRQGDQVVLVGVNLDEAPPGP